MSDPEEHDSEKHDSESTVDERIDPRLRPADPVGTRPRVEPESLLPESDEPLLRAAPLADVDAEGEEIPLDADDDTTPSGDLLPTRRPSGAPALAAPSGPSAHAGRFGFALGALLAVAVAGIVVAAVAISNRNDTGPPRPFWSAWTPVKGAGDGPKQIAQHIGAQYRLPTGRQLALVTSSALKVQGISLDVAEIGKSKNDSIKVIGGNKTVMYQMCGLSPGSCAIPGTPSTSRGVLVHREALELALYTFQYTDANGVVVILPTTYPRLGKTSKPDLKKPLHVAAYFPRKQFSQQLDRPVTATLTPTTPTVATVDKAPDALTVKTMTNPAIWAFSLAPSNTENKGYFVLQK